MFQRSPSQGLERATVVDTVADRPFLGGVFSRDMRVVLLLLAATVGPAQLPKLVSPQVDQGRRVTFRLHAPAAKAVKLWGEWILTFNTQEQMVRGDDGMWTATVGPLPPGIYQYLFLLDGVPVLDPNNPERADSSPYSLLAVPDVKPAPYDPRSVPHGEVHLHWYESATLGRRSIAVYIPPRYRDDDGTRYPVLYLLHGSGDTSMEWTSLGRANVILDNLLAEGTARPMIVVMPQAEPEGFDEYLLTELIPFVEDRYRVAAGRKSRAIAGQSMGGFLALAVWLRHAGSFGGVGVFGAGAHGVEGKQHVEEFASDPDRLADRPDVFWIGVGDQDSLRKDAEQLDSLLSKYELEHQFLLAEGQGHTWPFWRQCLSEFLPLLFRNRRTATE